jgi:flagellar hook-length control protein FliK
MTVQASKPLDPVKPPAATQRTAGRQAPNAADGGFAQLLKGQTAADRSEQSAKSDDEASGDKDKPVKDKSRSDETKAADATDTAAQPARPADPADDAQGQPAWWQALQAQRAAAADGHAGADALAALRDAALAKAGRADPLADATLAGTGKALAADKSHKGAALRALVDAADAGAAGPLALRADAVADQAAAPGDGNLPSLSGLLAAPATAPQHLGAAAASAAAASAEARLPMPPDHPAFPQALAVQLSTWLRDGVEHARLELHPQDLGPIDVRIAVTGGQTRVDLNADVAATRIALAQAIPQLAEVLGDVGLALSGSSVGAQTGQGGTGSNGADDGGPGRQGASRASAGRGGLGGLDGLDGLDAAGPSSRVVHQQGLLDLYA